MFPKVSLPLPHLPLVPDIFGSHDGKIQVRVVVTVQLTVVGTVKNAGLLQGIDTISDFALGSVLRLELISSDPLLGEELNKKPPVANVKLNVLSNNPLDTEVKYEAVFQVDPNFGELGAVLVRNEHTKEMFIKNIVLTGLPQGVVTVHCDTWIHSKFDNSEKRIFFTYKSSLPSETPAALKALREKELENLRGNGKGQRKASDRVYDYDCYNDLGDPDKNKEKLGRPVMGNKEHPYPRRCRTGRPHCRSDKLSETTSLISYIPRDENFADTKLISFGFNGLDSVLSSVIPVVESTFDAKRGFSDFQKINELFYEGIKLKDFLSPDKMIQVLPNLLTSNSLLRFPLPDMIQRDQFAWLRDEEFARETLAGINPYSIKLIQEWPLVSKLDDKTYGPPESAITEQLIEEHINMSFTEAFEQKKLFMLDYHDLLLPFVNKVRQVEGTTLYGSRTLFFLTSQGTLKPIAIELTRPPTTSGLPQWKQVFTPSAHATDSWLWKIAKAHVLAHDSVSHQLDSHWLRTHCVVETYIIATNRQLSAMHPINRLLKPYFRYTMQINGLARSALVNAGGIIESTFATDRYSIEFSSHVYSKVWRFDQEALPADLMKRGMAVEDPTAPHGLRLTIEDYPFATDGLLLWDAIEKWVTDYVSHYYPNEELVESDQELQEWWSEIRNKGHEDKKDEPWWPELKTCSELVRVLSTIIWVGSGHHAAVNFGQYTFGGYFPNRPTTARIKMPSENPTEEEWNKFVADPCDVLLQTFPSRRQATKVMLVLNVLSNHSPDEEYIGEQIEPSWSEDETIKAAFDKFGMNLKKIEATIDERNADATLRNRCGAGAMPYELLKPSSASGVTGRGVPNSISI